MAERIILASASSARQKMLADAGIAFTSQVARIDEETAKNSLIAEGADPRSIADMLAELKANRISTKEQDALVIGSDQVLAFEGKLVSKPTSIDEARGQLCQLRGKRHSLLSAAVIALNGQVIWRHVGQTRLWMRDFSDDYLKEYLNRLGDEALSTVGSYKLEAEGVRLFSRIEGDYFTVLGMPLIEILNYLADRGTIAT